MTATLAKLEECGAAIEVVDDRVRVRGARPARAPPT